MHERITNKDTVLVKMCWCVVYVTGSQSFHFLCCSAGNVCHIVPFLFPYLAAEAGADLSAPVTQWFQPNLHKTYEPPTCFHYDFWTLLWLRYSDFPADSPESWGDCV